MFRTQFIRILNPLSRSCVRNKSEPAINLEKLEQESATADDVIIDDEVKAREEEINRKRNKSRLSEQHRNVLNDKPPYSIPKLWTHGTLKYSRKMYGRYGTESSVNPSYCWPTAQELQDKILYEQVAYPYTIPEIVKDADEKRREKEERIHTRQMNIVKKMEKLEQFKSDLNNKIAKKERDAISAKDRKAKMVEEVRRHFGYTVDPRDEKFKEMLEKKEKEQKKAMKEAKKKVNQEKMISSLLNKKTENPQGTTEKTSEIEEPAVKD